MNTSLIDLSHTVEHGMVTYKGLPAPIMCDYLSREKQALTAREILRKDEPVAKQLGIGKRDFSEEE